MPVIHERMPAGFPGFISRKAGLVIEPVLLAENIPFGAPVSLNAKGEGVKASVATEIYGFLVRPYPTQSAISDFGHGSGEKGRPGDVMRSGYMTVQLSAAENKEPVKGDEARLLEADDGSFAQGELAASKGEDIPACTFTGGLDSEKIAEIAFNI